jgi:hypothetical protein
MGLKMSSGHFQVADEGSLLPSKVCKTQVMDRENVVFLGQVQWILIFRK